MRRAAVLIATGFGIGRIPLAPATATSFAVTILVAGLAAAAPAAVAPLPLGLLIAALVPIAIWSSGAAERELGTDAKPIVIDEVVGMLAAVWGIDAVQRGGGGSVAVLTAAFALFRLFDIVKPIPIRQSQRLPGGIGVVVDDLLAGAAANVVLRWLIGRGVLG